MALQIAGVTRPPASAGRNTSGGHRPVLADDDAYTKHKESGRDTKLHKNANTFT